MVDLASSISTSYISSFNCIPNSFSDTVLILVSVWDLKDKISLEILNIQQHVLVSRFLYGRQGHGVERTFLICSIRSVPVLSSSCTHVIHFINPFFFFEIVLLSYLGVYPISDVIFTVYQSKYLKKKLKISFKRNQCCCFFPPKAN